ncbi:MAG: hypothetical protein QW767_00310 [Thermoprotei archaeon]
MPKPPCKVETSDNEFSLSSIFGKEFVEDLVYNVFNPSEAEQQSNRDAVDEFLDEQASKWQDEMEQYIQEKFGVNEQNWMYRKWIEERAKREFLSDRAWQELLNAIRSGKIDVADISSSKLTKRFRSEVVRELSKEGYISSLTGGNDIRVGYSFGSPEFTPEGESVIAKKVLEEAIEEMDFPSIEFGSDDRGYGSMPSDQIVEFDESIHQYDNIDLQESLVESALHKSPDYIDLDRLKARVPASRKSSTNVILIDSSNSMYGPKFKGAVTASLALKRLLEERFGDDVLYVMAYDDEPILLNEGEILKLRPQGNTDIGRAIEAATEFLEKEEGNRNLFLITDGEPTASNREELTPEENAYKAAYEASFLRINLNIILLEQKPELRRIAERMAQLSHKSSIAVVEDPAHLKGFVIRSFAAMQGLGYGSLRGLHGRH